MFQCEYLSRMALATVYTFQYFIVFLHLQTGLAAFVLGFSQILFIVEHPLDVTFPSENKEYQIYIEKFLSKITSIIC